MAKRKRRIDARSVEKRMKEGRGEGDGGDYNPWLHIQDVPSLGTVTRIKGWKTGRVHHLLSRLELAYFYLLEWDLDVVDIREQYPLTPLEDVMALADDYGIRYPVDPRTRHPIIMTEDFLVSVRRGSRIIELPRAIKYVKDLGSKRTSDKLSIHRAYWETRGMTHHVVTEEAVPRIKVQNIQWLHPFREISALWPLGVTDIEQAAAYMGDDVARKPLADVAVRCDRFFGWDAGYGLAIIRHLLANRYWEVDMNVPLHPRRPLTMNRDGGTSSVAH